MAELTPMLCINFMAGGSSVHFQKARAWRDWTVGICAYVDDLVACALMHYVVIDCLFSCASHNSRSSALGPMLLRRIELLYGFCLRAAIVAIRVCSESGVTIHTTYAAAVPGCAQTSTMHWWEVRA